MRVSDLRSSKAAAPARRKKATSGKGGEFAARLKEATGAAQAAGELESPPVRGLDSILAVQEVSDPTEEGGRRAGGRYGAAMLDRLDELRHDLLAGRVSKDRLAGLARTMRAHRRQSADPALNEIIDEIELRAEVEIAKYTRGI